MHEISETMDASTAEVEAALKDDFNSMTTNAQSRMLDLLKKADPENYDWWLTLLVEPAPIPIWQISIRE